MVEWIQKLDFLEVFLVDSESIVGYDYLDVFVILLEICSDLRLIECLVGDLESGSLFFVEDLKAK